MPAESLPLPAFSAVLERHGPTLLRFCVSRAGPDRGEDVFQETMIAALRAYGEVRDPAAVRAWLYSIAARKAIDAHRSAARFPVPVAEPQPETGAETGAEAPPAPSPGDDIWRTVATLPEKQRQAVTLRFLADLSHREIASVMEISEAAVRRNVFEGLRRLRADLTLAPARASQHHAYDDH